MVGYELAGFVKSIAGRDKGDYFIIIDIDGEFLFLVDGKNRRVEKPKKKKKKHVQITHYISEPIKSKLISNEKLSNADIRREIKQFVER